MNDSEWVRSRRLPPPPALLERIELALSSHADDSTMSRSENFARAAAGVIAPLVAPDSVDASRDREVATNLLAVDALVTYAIEAAAEECGTIAQNVDRVIARLASLAPSAKI